MRDKAFKIVKNPKYDRYQRGFASMIYTFFDEKTDKKVKLIKVRSFQTKNQLKIYTSQSLKNSGKEKYAPPLADMQLINKFNKGTFFHYVLLIFIANMHGNTFQ